MSEMFEDVYEDQEWYDIGADLRIKIRKQFSDLRKSKNAEIEKLQAEIAKLTRQRDILKKALEFYADGNNWSTINHMASVVTYDRLEYDKDLGDGAFQINEETNDEDVSGMRARKALQEAEGME